MNKKPYFNRYKALVFIILIFACSATIVLLTKGIGHTLVLSAGVGIILFFSKMIWLPDGYGKTRVRVLSLLIAAAAAVPFALWQLFLHAIVSEKWPEYAKYLNLSPALMFGFLAFVIWIVNYYNQDKTGMGKHPGSLSEDIPELRVSYKDELKNIADALFTDLRTIDVQTNWSTQLFTPLDAEVEVVTPRGKQKQISDLFRAIKKNPNEKLFLVLGDPGSGKSVALRKLCQDLLVEVPETGKIPIYVNLKEWQVNEKWTLDNLPTIEELYDFVYKNVRERDIVTRRFFTKYFDRLYDKGRLFFVLDSFDEIPAVLDESENSELIQKLSEMIFKFLSGNKIREPQGILSSRQFRRPTKHFQSNIVLEIRPFSEAKIIQTLRRATNFNQQLVNDLFRSRPELVPVARNPFMATLITNFAEVHNNKLPKNQSELYASYINQTLDLFSDRIEKRNLTKPELLATSISMAELMFSDYGLEARVEEFYKHLPKDKVDSVIDILTTARLGRRGTGDDNRFSFVHRRFTEYFAVQKLLDGSISVNLQAIPNDSQWRDALVLYCELAPFEKAQEIADFCWEQISEINNPQDIRVIHCLRFIRDAFRSRLDCIKKFQDELAEYIYSQIRRRNNMITVELSLETVGILSEVDLERCVSKAIRLENHWIRDSAFRACRGLSEIKLPLRRGVTSYLLELSPNKLLRNWQAIRFSLSLSEAFKFGQGILFVKFTYYMVIICLTAGFWLAAPELFSFLIITFCIMWAIFPDKSKMNSIYNEEETDTRDGRFSQYTRWNIIDGFFDAKFMDDLYVESRNFIGPLKSFFKYQSKDDLSFIRLCLFLASYFVTIIFVLNVDLEKIGTSIEFISLFQSNFIPTKELILLPFIYAFLVIIPIDSLLYKDWKGVFNSIRKYDLWVLSLLKFQQFVLAFMPILLICVILTFLATKALPLIVNIGKLLAFIIPEVVKELYDSYQAETQIGVIIFLLASYFLIRKVIVYREFGSKLKSKLNSDYLSDRVNIFQVYSSIKNPENVERFIQFLEVNVKDVKGHWPDNEILDVTIDKNLTRLAQLDKKWLGLQ